MNTDIYTLTYNYLIESGLFTEGELDLCTALTGANIETLNTITRKRYGFESVDLCYIERWENLPRPCNELLRQWLDPWNIDADLREELFPDITPAYESRLLRPTFFLFTLFELLTGNEHGRMA